MLKLDNEWATIEIYYVPFLLVLLTTVFVLYITRNNNYWKKRGVPYIPPKPLFGNFFDVLTLRRTFGSTLRLIYERVKEPFIGVFLLDQPCLVLNDLDLIKRVLVKDADHFQNKSNGINPRDDPIGSNILFFSKMPLWKVERKNVSPIFSTGKLKSQINLAAEHGVKLTRAIEEKISEEGNIINIKKFTNKHTINCIISCFFSLKGDIFENDHSPFLKVSEKLMNFKAIAHALQAGYMFIAPKFFKMFRMKFVDSSSTRFFRELCWELLGQREMFEEKKNDLIDILLDLKQKKNITEPTSFDADVLAAHVCQIFAAGFETTSMTICYTLYELAKHPECQRLARQEIMEIGKKPDEFDYEHLKRMKYIRNCIQEALRLYTLSPFLDRQCTREYRLPGTELILEKGQSVYIPVWGIHLNPEYYPNPLQFDPNRFTEENIRNRPDFTFLGFGGGIRNCPGQRFGIFNAISGVANILHKYELKIPDGVSKTMEFSTMGFALQPKHDILLEVHEIK